MEEFNLNTLVLGMVQTNCYVISNTKTKEAIVIDPADRAEVIEQYLKNNDLVCQAILLTHGHFDHILAANELANLTTAPIYAHEDEVKLLKDSKLNASFHAHRNCEVVPDILLKDQDNLTLAGFAIRVIHTPGHTGGGVCYYFTGEKILISGDTLFYESIGRTDLPTGNGTQLIKSIQDKLMILDENVRVYPGHGESTTIGYEKENNLYL